MDRVLLVNSHKELGDAMETLLSLKGFESRCTTSEENFMNIINEFAPSIIILNMVMANNDSFEICQSIRRLDSENKIKLILLGKPSYFTKRLHAFKLTGMLSNPFAIEDLFSLLENKN